MILKLPASQKPAECDVHKSDGLKVALSVRPIRDIATLDGLVPRGTRSVSLFLVNRRKPAPDEERDIAFAFQAALEVRCEHPFVPRPNLRGLDSDDWDERVADLQYRDVCEFAVGHGISTRAVLDDQCESRITSAGVSVLMRYTLRLLTLDQLSRAATLICALEMERQHHADKLGDWPFEIGLWVGRAATPNEMGRKGDGKDHTARMRTIHYKNSKSPAPPIPLEECP